MSAFMLHLYLSLWLPWLYIHYIVYWCTCSFTKSLQHCQIQITPCYLRPISKLLEVRLASICYLDIQNIDVKTTFSFSLYATLLLVILVTYFRSITQGDLQRTSLPEDNEVCHHQYWRIVSILVNFQNKVYNVNTSLYTKYSAQSSYLGIETVSKLLQFWIVLRYWNRDLQSCQKVQ